MNKYITVIVCVLLLLSACSNSKSEVSHKDTVTIKKTFEYKEKNKDHKVKSVKSKVNDDTVMFANVDQKGIKTYGKTGRYGGFLSGDLGIKHIDPDMPANSSGQLVSYEYIAEKNPDKIFYINRTDDDSKGLPQELKNPVIKNVSAIKNKDILKFDSNTWFFGSGGISSTIKQLDDIEKAY
ncbi:ABC transporter substrate-binding protein [Mammaliicoccus sciuri]|uniref:ABC transporter substrate-binding protein n=1 Tax=Mammaliicoccus sciuri TaxID=1296 RepID=UPI001FB20FDD|nr:ABC transporter substrate-binding protein [Mammaliicoccus sciuri]MCJ0966836.1 ABC transporter substrate-binding protein [Mammaliicoccus sciuri]